MGYAAVNFSKNMGNPNNFPTDNNNTTNIMRKYCILSNNIANCSLVLAASKRRRRLC